MIDTPQIIDMKIRAGYRPPQENPLACINCGAIRERKPFSAQVLKANMKIVGNCEYGLVLYRDKLPKFNNHGQMIFNCFEWMRDGKEIPKCHPTQKPVRLLRRLIEIFTDPGDVVIDPVCGSGSTLRAAAELGRRSFGFEINKKFCEAAQNRMLKEIQPQFNFPQDPCELFSAEGAEREAKHEANT